VNAKRCIAALAANLLLVSSLAANVRLEGEPFVPSAPLRWGATNAPPQKVILLRAGKKSFPESALTNLLSYTSFHSTDLAQSDDPGVVVFRSKQGKSVRILKVSQSEGLVSYTAPIDTDPHGVPSAERAVGLAFEFLSRLGVPTNEIANLRTGLDQTITTYDKKGGKEIGKEISRRGVAIERQFNGMRGLGYLTIGFGNDEKPMFVDLHWKRFQPDRELRCVTPDEILGRIKSGKSVVTPYVTPVSPVPPNPKLLTIVGITPRYDLEIMNGFAYPYAQIWIRAELDGGAKVDFAINCPIIVDDSL
jgi:hypothetical protein